MKNRGLFFWGFAVLFTLFAILFVDIRYSTVSDSLVKTIQAYSVVENQFAGEELYYPARNLDPEFDFFAFRAPFLVGLEGRHLGQYPVFLSFLLAPFVAILGAPYLSLFSLLWLFGTLFFLRYYWKLSVPVLFFTLLATYLFPLALEISENSLMIFLNVVGTSLLVTGLEKNRNRDLVLGGLVSGVSIWLRLEAIPYMALLLLSMLVLSGIREKKSWKAVLLAGISFSIPALLFVGFNLWDYGHFLGPRFSENYRIHENPVFEQLRRLLVLTFFGNFKIGFFLYIPLFLLVGVYFAFPKNYRSLPKNLRILYWTGFGLIPVAGLIAPNDGVANAGPRYMELSIFPILMVAVHFWDQISATDSGRVLRIANKGTIAFSVLMTLLTLTVYSGAVKQMKRYQKYFQTAEADIWLFDRQTCGFVGLRYFETPVMCVYSDKKLKELKERIGTEAEGKRLAYFRLKKDTEDSVVREFHESFPVWKSEEKQGLQVTVYSIPPRKAETSGTGAK